MDIKLKLREYLDANYEQPLMEDRCIRSSLMGTFKKARAYDMSYESASISAICLTISKSLSLIWKYSIAINIFSLKI